MDLVRKYILLELPPYWSIGSRWCRETMGLWLPPIVERAFQRTERTNSCTASVLHICIYMSQVRRTCTWIVCIVRDTNVLKISNIVRCKRFCHQKEGWRSGQYKYNTSSDQVQLLTTRLTVRGHMRATCLNAFKNIDCVQKYIKSDARAQSVWISLNVVGLHFNAINGRQKGKGHHFSTKTSFNKI